MRITLKADIHKRISEQTEEKANLSTEFKDGTQIREKENMSKLEY